MRPSREDTSADAQPNPDAGSDLSLRSRVELDLGPAGCVVDWANTLAWGLVAGAGIASWLTLCLGMTSAFGADAVASDRVTRSGFTAFLLATLAGYVVASLVSAVRTLLYARHVGEALRHPEAPPVADYQAWTAAGDTTFGRPFVAWSAIGILVLAVGGLMTIAAVSFVVEGEQGSSTLIAVGVAAGCLALGIALLVAVRRLRALRTRYCPDDPRPRRPPHPRGARRVPSPPSRSHRVVVRIRAIALTTMFVVLFGGIGAFVAWGVISGQVVMVGGRVRTLPDAARRALSSSELAARGVVATILAAASLTAVLLLLAVTVLGAARRAIAVRALSAAVGSSAGGATRPRKAISEDALNPSSGARTATGLAGAVAVVLIVVAASPLATVIPVLAPGALVALGVLALAVTATIDIVTESRARRRRNVIFAAWPSAQAFTSRFKPTKR